MLCWVSMQAVTRPFVAASNDTTVQLAFYGSATDAATLSQVSPVRQLQVKDGLAVTGERIVCGCGQLCHAERWYVCCMA